MPTIEFDFDTPVVEDRVSKGYVCSCCGSYVKMYCRSLNCNMAIACIALYRYSKGEYVHVEKFLSKHGYQRCGDFSYLRFYNFIEKKAGKREDGSTRTGLYRLTGLGVMWVEGKITAKSKFKILNNQFKGFEGKDITIQEALGVKFRYDELMGLEK